MKILVICGSEKKRALIYVKKCGGEWWLKIASKNRLWQTGRRTLSHIELLLQLKRGLLCHNIKMSRHYLRV